MVFSAEPILQYRQNKTKIHWFMIGLSVPRGDTNSKPSPVLQLGTLRYIQTWLTLETSARAKCPHSREAQSNKNLPESCMLTGWERGLHSDLPTRNDLEVIAWQHRYIHSHRRPPSVKVVNLRLLESLVTIWLQPLPRGVQLCVHAC